MALWAMSMYNLTMKKSNKTKSPKIQTGAASVPKGSVFYGARDTQWLDRNPYSARVTGVILGLSLVLPLIASTFLERGFGDDSTVIILVGTILVSGAAGLWLSRIKFALIPLALLFLIFGCIFSIFITMTTSW